jgi:hypothetical protein
MPLNIGHELEEGIDKMRKILPVNGEYGFSLVDVTLSLMNDNIIFTFNDGETVALPIFLFLETMKKINGGTA